MNTHEFTEQDVIELIGADLGLPAELAELVNNDGDVKGCLTKRLMQRKKEELAFHLSQQAPEYEPVDFFEVLYGREGNTPSSWVHRKTLADLANCR